MKVLFEKLKHDSRATISVAIKGSLIDEITRLSNAMGLRKAEVVEQLLEHGLKQQRDYEATERGKHEARRSRAARLKAARLRNARIRDAREAAAAAARQTLSLVG